MWRVKVQSHLSLLFKIEQVKSNNFNSNLCDQEFLVGVEKSSVQILQVDMQIHLLLTNTKLLGMKETYLYPIVNGPFLPMTF